MVKFNHTTMKHCKYTLICFVFFLSSGIYMHCNWIKDRLLKGLL